MPPADQIWWHQEQGSGQVATGSWQLGRYVGLTICSLRLNVQGLSAANRTIIQMIAPSSRDRWCNPIATMVFAKWNKSISIYVRKRIAVDMRGTAQYNILTTTWSPLTDHIPLWTFASDLNSSVISQEESKPSVQWQLVGHHEESSLQELSVGMLVFIIQPEL